tara:strand:+ start:1670 stop:1795 length:126 start_codon:yes stop_codon:yes gene_type:complete
MEKYTFINESKDKTSREKDKKPLSFYRRLEEFAEGYLLHRG